MRILRTRAEWIEGEVTTSRAAPYKNILKVQALLRDLNYDSGSRNEKKGTETRNIVMEKKSMGLGNRPDGEEKGKTSEFEDKSSGGTHVSPVSPAVALGPSCTLSPPASGAFQPWCPGPRP